MKKFIFFSLLCASCQSYAMYDALFKELNEQNAPAIIGLRNKIHNHIPSLFSYASLHLDRPIIEGNRSNEKMIDKHLTHKNSQALTLFSGNGLREAMVFQDTVAPRFYYVCKNHNNKFNIHITESSSPEETGPQKKFAYIEIPFPHDEHIYCIDHLWHYLIRQKDISSEFFMQFIREKTQETRAFVSLLDHLKPSYNLGEWFDRDTLLILYARCGKFDKFKQLFDESTRENQLSEYPTFLPIIQECLQQAIDNDQVDVVQFLVENPVSFKDIAFHRLSLSKVAQKGSAVIEYFLTSAKPVFSRDYYSSVFNTAAQYKNITLCEMLYKQGIRPSDYYVRSYIENAVQEGDFEWASMLKKHCAGIEKK